MDQLQNSDQRKKQNVLENQPHLPRSKKVKKRKPLFLSYCLSSDFHQLRFVFELASQLQEISFAKDLWCDFHEIPLDSFSSPIAYATRFEAAEKSKAAIIVVSEKYLQCKVCLTILHILKLKRRRHSSFRVFTVQFSTLSSVSELDKVCDYQSQCYIDFSKQPLITLSTAEKVVSVLRAFSEYLEIYSTGVSSPTQVIPNKSELIDFRTVAIPTWNTLTVLQWLRSLRVDEKTVMVFEELEVTGLQLLTLDDATLGSVFAIDSKGTKRRIQNSIAYFKEQSRKDSKWYQVTQYRQRPDNVYLVHDPADEILAQLIARDLQKKGFKVVSHAKLGETREEFLLQNCPLISKCDTVAILLSRAANISPFVYHEAVIALWLRRRIISVLFHNSLDAMKISLRGIVGTEPAIDFHTTIYVDALELLAHELRSKRTGMTVVYENAFLRLVSERIKPLDLQVKADSIDGRVQYKDKEKPFLYFSYHWDYQSEVCSLMDHFENKIGIECISDMDYITRSLNIKMQSKCTQQQQKEGQKTSDGDIEDAINKASAIVICVSRKYFNCQHRLQEIKLSKIASKPIVPVLMEWMHWPPVYISVDLRMILVMFDPFDLSTVKTRERNLPLLQRELETVTKR